MRRPAITQVQRRPVEAMGSPGETPAGSCEWVVDIRDSARNQEQRSLPAQGQGSEQWCGLAWHALGANGGIRAYQGHQHWVIKEHGMASMCRELLTLDDGYSPPMLDRGDMPRLNRQPERSNMWTNFPRVLYHTCDVNTMHSIIRFGLIPGGHPKKTGRAHNYFTSVAPWKADMRKLAGTRAGQPIYLAFDTELLMQLGVRRFVTKEAIISPDWIPNCALMFAYNQRHGQHLWSNRVYSQSRNEYIQQHDQRF